MHSERRNMGHHTLYVNEPPDGIGHWVIPGTLRTCDYISRVSIKRYIPVCPERAYLVDSMEVWKAGVRLQLVPITETIARTNTGSLIQIILHVDNNVVPFVCLEEWPRE
jgi:hypothetical protein